ncbi:(2Fe-2S)-binding protein [Paenibacillus sp. WLX1005]|uniref:(2Fe-2S)-binding protein n=1 Tax=Paenibacillus sp. WLX1005 TaxID=3243766 RepID=UPI0039844AE3
MGHIIQPDWEQLRQQFYIVNEPQPDVLYRIPFVELATPQGMKSFLEDYAPRLGAPDLVPAATFFCSWLTGLPLAVQYYLSVHQTAMRLSLQQLTLNVYMSGAYCQFAFEADTLWLEPVSGDRDLLRYHTVAAMYEDILRPLLESMAAVTGEHVRMLWRQIPARYYYFVQLWQQQMEEPVRIRLEQDLNYVLNELPADVFALSRNPLRVPPRYTDNLERSGQVLIRSACCLYHKMDGGEYCFNCPKVSEDVREERRLAYESKEG